MGTVFANSGARLVNSESGGRNNFTFRQETKDRIAETLKNNHNDHNYKLEHSRVRGGKPLYIFDKRGNFINEYQYASQACDDLEIGRPHISSVLNGSKVLASGYIAINKDEYSFDKFKKHLGRIKQNPVNIIDITTGVKTKANTCNVAINNINNTKNKRNTYNSYNTYGCILINSNHFIYNDTAYKFGIGKNKQANINRIWGTLISTRSAKGTL